MSTIPERDVVIDTQLDEKNLRADSSTTRELEFFRRNPEFLNLVRNESRSRSILSYVLAGFFGGIAGALMFYFLNRFGGSLTQSDIVLSPMSWTVLTGVVTVTVGFIVYWNWRTLSETEMLAAESDLRLEKLRTDIDELIATGSDRDVPV